MGRSEGKARLKNILLGSAQMGVKENLRRQSVLSPSLEKEVKELVNGDLPATREEFYQSIAPKLAEINTNLLAQDPTFLMLLKKENKFFKKDTGFALTEGQLNSLAQDFAQAFKDYKFPHLGREALNSNLFGYDEQKKVVDSYLNRATQLSENPALFNQFAFGAVLPLAEGSDFDKPIFNHLAQLVALINQDRASVKRVIKSLTLYEQELFRTKELEKVTSSVNEFLSTNAFNDQFSLDSLQDSVNSAQKEVITEAIFFRLAKNSKLLRRADPNRLGSKAEQINYLDKVINQTGLIKKDSSFEAVSSIYFLIGGERREHLNDLKPVFKKSSLTAEDIHLAIDKTLAGWVPTSHLTLSGFYNHALVFLNEIEAVLANNAT